jgi:6-phosphogluconate dehydrogenase
MVGLGRMGANMSERLIGAGHEVVGYDRSADACAAAAGRGVIVADDTADLVASLDAPRVVWFMLPAAVTGPAIDEVAGMLSPGDVVVDGGNGHYHEDIARAAEAAGLRVRRQGLALLAVCFVWVAGALALVLWSGGVL